MSFILDALRKSESKRRKKSTQLPRSIHEPARDTISGTRQLKVLIVVFLVIIILLLLWLTRSTWQGSRPALTRSGEQSIIPPQKKETSPQGQPDQMITATGPPAPERFSSPVTAQQEPVLINSEPVDLPIPRTERKVYAFSQLPASIRQQIPELQMALHAYNRDHGESSMVQLNKRIYRQGDNISQTLQLETITPEGAIIRYDGYRFLLPRRNQ